MALVTTNFVAMPIARNAEISLDFFTACVKANVNASLCVLLTYAVFKCVCSMLIKSEVEN